MDTTWSDRYGSAVGLGLLNVALCGRGGSFAVCFCTMAKVLEKSEKAMAWSCNYILEMQRYPGLRSGGVPDEVVAKSVVTAGSSVGGASVGSCGWFASQQNPAAFGWNGPCHQPNFVAPQGSMRRMEVSQAEGGPAANCPPKMQGLEEIMAKYFGSNGYLSEDDDVCSW